MIYCTPHQKGEHDSCICFLPLPWCSSIVDDLLRSLDVDGLLEHQRIWLFRSGMTLQRIGTDSERTKSSRADGAQVAKCANQMVLVDMLDTHSADKQWLSAYHRIYWVQNWWFRLNTQPRFFTSRRMTLHFFCVKQEKSTHKSHGGIQAQIKCVHPQIMFWGLTSLWKAGDSRKTENHQDHQEKP